ncbi:MAG TPA: hypothetical protein VG433_05095 [Pirellulales bacterium]|jgi:hypothetical protein|nr:hypothetical protein [Pirellulales bacterium]
MVVLLGSLAAVVGAAAGGIYVALAHVPHFYDQALDQPPEKQQQGNDALIKNANALASSARRQGGWSAVFTADEINGWLGVDLAQSFPDVLPAEISEPRIRLSPGGATIACRYRENGVSTIISLNVELYMAEPNVLALRIHNIRAGAIPIPLSQVLDGVTEAARSMNLRLRWVQAKGDPVALVSLPSTIGRDKIAFRLEKIDLRQDAIYLAGQTEKLTEPRQPAQPKVADSQASAHLKTQR